MYDIVIIGSGTAGLTIANLLSNLGLKICLIEKRGGINEISKAVGINDECLSAWQMCGVLEKISDCIGSNNEGETILNYLDSNRKKIFSLCQSLGVGNFPIGVVAWQRGIDEVLLKNLDGKVDVRFHEELIDITQNHESVSVKTSRGIYEAKYVIAADGRESAARQLLGIKMNLMSESKDEWLILNLFAKNRVLTKEFAEVFCGSERSVVSCPLPRDHHRLEISLKENEREILHDENKIRELVAAYTDLKNYEIVDKFKLRFTTAIAEKYHDGRVVLCGDAAHCTAPFAAAGLVSGVRDCLALYEIFRSGDISFSRYQTMRYNSQINSLKLAMRLEKVMRPGKFCEKLLFAAIRILARSSAFVRNFSLRNRD